MASTPPKPPITRIAQPVKRIQVQLRTHRSHVGQRGSFGCSAPQSFPLALVHRHSLLLPFGRLQCLGRDLGRVHRDPGEAWLVHPIALHNQRVVGLLQRLPYPLEPDVSPSPPEESNHAHTKHRQTEER